MKCRIIILLFCAFVVYSSMAQTEHSDSISTFVPRRTLGTETTLRLTSQSLDSISFVLDIDSIIPSTFHNYHISVYPCYSYIVLGNPILASFNPSFAYPGIIYGNENLQFKGDIESTAYPGMMNKAVGTLGTSLSFGRSSVYFGGIVNKYAYYGGLIRQLGLNAVFSYQFSSPLSFSAFTYYYGRNAMPMMPDGSPMPPFMLGYYDVSRFGGYVNYKPSERFGIMMGGQMVERHGLRGNHYELEPIATPYINVGRGKNKVGIGLPVGQILYGIFGR